MAESFQPKKEYLKSYIEFRNQKIRKSNLMIKGKQESQSE